MRRSSRLHGLEELGAKLHAMSVAGRWNEMPAEVTDDVVRIFAACGTYSEIAQAIEARFGGLADAIELNFPAGTPAGLQRELVADIRRIPHRFEGFDTQLVRAAVRGQPLVAARKRRSNSASSVGAASVTAQKPRSPSSQWRRL